MQLNAGQIESHLQQGLAPVYLVTGDEPLLAQECADAIRRAAQAAGYDERTVATVEAGFDWQAWFDDSQALSLFSARRLLELRLPTGKPGEAGSRVLSQYAASPPADTALVVVTPRLDKAARAAKWVAALEAAGALVSIYPVEGRALIGWIGQRLRERGLAPEAGVAELMADHYEGNLLAAAQEVDKLVMAQGRGPVTLDDIQGNLRDNARFDVFSLVDAALRGDGPAVVRILASLRAEGVEPVLILWALARETRTLARVAARLAAGEPEGRVFPAHQVWPRRAPLVKQALRRGRPEDWRRLLRRAARVDRVAKGRGQGDVWRELQCLVLALAGVPVLTCA